MTSIYIRSCNVGPYRIMSGDDVKSRSDLIATKIGAMLLKGYKMLSTSCETCNVSINKITKKV